LAPVRAFGHEKQAATYRFGPLGQQVNLDDGSHVRVKRHPSFPPSLADYLQPAAADVDVRDVQGQHFRRAQSAVEQKASYRPVPPCAEARQ